MLLHVKLKYYIIDISIKWNKYWGKNTIKNITAINSYINLANEIKQLEILHLCTNKSCRVALPTRLTKINNIYLYIIYIKIIYSNTKTHCAVTPLLSPIAAISFSWIPYFTPKRIMYIQSRNGILNNYIILLIEMWIELHVP